MSETATEPIFDVVLPEWMTPYLKQKRCVGFRVVRQSVSAQPQIESEVISDQPLIVLRKSNEDAESDAKRSM